MDSKLLKERVLQAIDEQRESIIKLTREIEKHPELGYKEAKTAALVKQLFSDIGLSYSDNLAVTGVKAKLKETGMGPNIAILGEMDAVICPDSSCADPLTGASHACGHHLQLGAMLGAAMGLTLGNVSEHLDGNVSFMAVPAEEYVEIAYRLKLREEGKIHYLGGKQELIYRGVFDDVDMAMMIHSAKNTPEPTVFIGESSNGFIAKTIHYVGKEAHAAEAPEEGINALNAAMLGLMGIHTLRETFPDSDIVRVHPIITKGGDLVNSVPADVRLETYVRAKTMASIEATHVKVDRALIAGGQAIGAKCKIQSLPGYLPLACSSDFNEMFVKNSRQFLSESSIKNSGHFGASTDMGDVSCLMPVIHPYIGGVTGALHTREFKVVDYDAACILPAKLMAMTVIDLLADQAVNAKKILRQHCPLMQKDEYIRKMNDYFSGV
ncbi:amidohydrolase [Sporomusa acidovorans]|uniref:Peptidase M20 domain-containing protein 2 n=1 Tax=Sporomusa acidovorans (strain ATCC 49682 / DSM 3132 / Mol) TaxID=1123286 RepID=A0ABZ3J2J4_SPOA4|nr:amidohydrolase [Sporomusa acidovorans]OZC23193.1 p-aminobenzoyl-glutamate hydrolase subunit B [Sporomusa acidovorans DSM 3132]SDE97284.1 amidohydrolase [Sporomusa acidovorans]